MAEAASVEMALTKEEIKSMGYWQLRKACSREGLSTSGNIRALRRRLLKAETEENDPSPKQPKKSVADDLICPISQELPFDPVHAEDGQVYERASIEEYFATKESDDLVKSPAKGHMMGQVLLPAPHIKNIIETSIENCQITGDLADKWLEKFEEKKSAEKMLKKAENGDVEAMVEVGHGYYFGQDGFTEDDEKAFHWYEKACTAGNATAMAKAGEFLLEGIGVEENRQQGAFYLGQALGKGSAMAAYFIGLYLADELHGFDADAAEAKRLLKKSLETSMKESDFQSEEERKEAQEKLDELDDMSRVQELDEWDDLNSDQDEEPYDY